MKTEDKPRLDDLGYDHLDFTSFSPLQSVSELAPVDYVGSPFSCDFGNDIGGFHFLDGTGEQDVSLTEILDVALHSHDESSCEESPYQENFASGKKDHLSQKQNIMPGSLYNGSYSDTYNNTAQVLLSSAHFFKPASLSALHGSHAHLMLSCWKLCTLVDFVSLTVL